MMDSGHRWMRDCNECLGWHHCAAPKHDASVVEDWVCAPCVRARAALSEAEQERDDAVADNAALVERNAELFEVAGIAAEVMEWGGWRYRVLKALSRPQTTHPGRALLEKHREELAAAARRHETTLATMQIREEQHRKEREAFGYADDNTRAFAVALCETIEEAERRANTPKGGQSVPNHMDFAHVQPNTRGELRRWARCGRAALKGERSALLVRARNEGLEMAAARFDGMAGTHQAYADTSTGEKACLEWSEAAEEMRSHAREIRAMKEPEE